MKTPRSLRSRQTTERRFEKALAPHLGALHAATRRLTRSVADAEDLLQEVLCRAFDRLDSLETMEYPKAWLLKVTYNQFIDMERKQQRSPLGRTSEEGPELEQEAQAGSEWEPDNRLDSDIRLSRILRAMSLLDANQCALVAMHDIDGVSIDELSEQTGMPPGTIKSQLHRTRARLGRLLAVDPALKPQLSAVGK